MTTSGERACLRQSMGHGTQRTHANFWCVASSGSTGVPTRNLFGWLRRAGLWCATDQLQLNLPCGRRPNDEATVVPRKQCKTRHSAILAMTLSTAWRKSRNHPPAPIARGLQKPKCTTVGWVRLLRLTLCISDERWAPDSSRTNHRNECQIRRVGSAWRLVGPAGRVSPQIGAAKHKIAPLLGAARVSW